MNSKSVVQAFLLVAFLLASNAQPQDTSGLSQYATPLGIRVGFEISPVELTEQIFRDVVKREASVGTLPTYWHMPEGEPGIDLGRSRNTTNPLEVFGTYDFSRPAAVEDFCLQNDIEIHGHPLVWALDRYTPPWVTRIKGDQAVSLLRNHVSAVVSEFRGTVRVWHVVNEAFDYEGKLVDCYWNRVLGVPAPKAITPRYVNIAFQAAANADPTAHLIYNDFGQEELDPRKFNAIVAMLVNMRMRGIPIHGLGWQMHVTASQVLDPDFPLEARLNLVAQLGFDNHITELDIVMDEWNLDGTLPPPKAVYNLKDQARQAAAYKKVVEIFTRSERCVSLQFWGVSDKQSWLGAERKPLLFDKFYRKKPAYEAVKSALSVAAP